MTVGNKITVLVTAISAPTGYGIVRCLQGVDHIRVIGVDSDQRSPTMNFVDKFFVVPRVADPSFLKSIKNLADSNDVDVVFPTLHDELLKLLQLNIDATVVGGPLSAVETALDKVRMYRTLADKGLDRYVPEFQLLSNSSDTVRVAEALGYPDVPVCLKPIGSHAGIGFKTIATPREIAARLDRGLGWNWCTLEEVKLVLEHVGDTQKMMMCEFLPGDEFSVDVLADNGTPLTAVARKRSRLSGPIVIDGIVKNRPDLVRIAEEVVRALALDYFCNVQIKYSSLGEPKVIDVNPRFCGSQVTSFGAGVNFPLLCTHKALGLEFDIPEPEWGVQMKRYWENVFFRQGDEVPLPF